MLVPFDTVPPGRLATRPVARGAAATLDARVVIGQQVADLLGRAGGARLAALLLPHGVLALREDAGGEVGPRHAPRQPRLGLPLVAGLATGPRRRGRLLRRLLLVPVAGPVRRLGRLWRSARPVAVGLAGLLEPVQLVLFHAVGGVRGRAVELVVPPHRERAGREARVGVVGEALRLPGRRRGERLVEIPRAAGGARGAGRRRLHLLAEARRQRRGGGGGAPRPRAPRDLEPVGAG